MNHLHKTAERLLHLLYPPRCPLCHRILGNPDRLICEDCAGHLKPVSGARCLKCGNPVGGEEEYCIECRNRKRGFTAGKGIFPYDEKMKASVLKYKYQGCREFGWFYAFAMYRYAGRELALWKPDILVPIPMHPRKQRVRGFNQAEDLAEKLSDFSGIPAAEGILRKTKRTKSQKKLDARSRRQNLKGAFQACRRLDGLKILLIDDVYTTGSTVEAAAECLLQQGAEQVFFLTLCQGSGEEGDSGQH